MIKLISATVECDGCGGEFRVELDGAHRPAATLYDAAVDYVRGGKFIDAPRSPACNADPNICSVRDDKLLCPACTNKGPEESRNS